MKAYNTYKPLFLCHAHCLRAVEAYRISYGSQAYTVVYLLTYTVEN